MIDVGKGLQSAYDYGYRQGVKDTLDDIHKTLERSLRENFAHLIKTEPSNSEKPNNSTISKMEQVEDETKTQMKTQNSNLTFEKADEPQTDCAWK